MRADHDQVRARASAVSTIGFQLGAAATARAFGVETASRCERRRKRSHLYRRATNLIGGVQLALTKRLEADVRGLPYAED